MRFELKVHLVSFCLSFALFLYLAACVGDDSSSNNKDASNCGQYPPQSTSPYVLPYEIGESFTVSQTLAHGFPQTHAIDFLISLGTNVTAARAGKVTRVVQNYSDDDHVWGHENRVWVQHPDGTVARCFRLMQYGARVVEGAAVVQGTLLGWSGNSRNSTAPHLHFDVTKCVPNDSNYNNLPCGETVPVTFKNTSPNPCGLVVGQGYTAQPY